MSEYHEIKTQYRDPECLVKALAEMGYSDVEMHAEAQNLYGYHADMREDKANIIVRRKHISTSANDIGFIKGADGNYNAIISEYDSHKHNTSWLNGLKKHYTEAVTMKTAKKSGLTFLGKKVVAGRVQLQFLDGRKG